MISAVPHPCQTGFDLRMSSLTRYLQRPSKQPVAGSIPCQARQPQSPAQGSCLTPAIWILTRLADCVVPASISACRTQSPHRGLGQVEILSDLPESTDPQCRHTSTVSALNSCVPFSVLSGGKASVCAAGTPTIARER